jgi:hypothetical protein
MESPERPIGIYALTLAFQEFSERRHYLPEESP